MKSEKILDMLNAGQIEELKEKLADEIYTENLKEKPNAKKRYAAMKRFYKYTQNNYPESIKAPAKNLSLTIYDDPVLMTSFMSRYGVALTREDIGTMEDFSTLYPDKEYVNVQGLFTDFNGYQTKEEINVEDILARAKALGYRYSKKEITPGEQQYFWNYRDAYYAIGFLDQMYSIVADKFPAIMYYINNTSITWLETTIGICGILPARMTENVKSHKIIIRGKEE